MYSFLSTKKKKSELDVLAEQQQKNTTAAEQLQVSLAE